MLLSFDWLWFLALLCLVASGILTIWSSSPGVGFESFPMRQFIYLCMAIVVFVVLLYFDYHAYSDYIPILYAVGIAVLILVLFAGRSINSSRSWIGWGTWAFQPSEIMKILVILALAKYYSESERDYLELGELAFGAVITFVPLALVVLQGDLGTAVTFVPIYLVLSFITGVRRKYALVVLLIALAASPIGWMMLKDYQRGRILTILNPNSDPLHLGYQTIQSEIAIGSGRFLGKGFKQGSQSQLGFLPARHTDFLFAVLSEERGFVGSIAVLCLFLFVLIRLWRAGRDAKDRVGLMIVFGVFSLLLFHVLINIGMVLGLLPITGIPLPFLSAGGSSLISSFVAMSLCMNVHMRRYVN